ncbi:MAG: Hpt domain-containing protein [Thermodesulfobacteriota bacterium]|nr:Hpt domain-containing protein [Thermodesulfobacteriota bacterium]
MENDPKIFDPKELLENLMDDKELVQTILEGFLMDIPEQIKTLEDYLEKKDIEGVERQAHTIKGACGNVGAAALQAIAYEMEKAGNAGDFEAVQKGMPELSSGFEILKQLIEATVEQWQS